MAGKKQNKREAGSEPQKRTGAGKKTDAGKRADTGRKAGRSRDANADTKGITTLREAAGNAVGKNSGHITASLFREVLNGKTGSRKLLIGLAALQTEPDGAKKTGRGRSVVSKWAAKWAAEPQWQDEETEAAAAMAPGDGEPAG